MGVTVAAVRKVAEPCGFMKIPHQREFAVYDPALIPALRDHPEIVKSRARKESTGRRREAAMSGADSRREKCVELLNKDRPDLRDLYAALVARLWFPGTEKYLLTERIFKELPALLWDALLPEEGFEGEAREIIVNILWAMTKQRTWKVHREWGVQSEPLVYEAWRRGYPVEPHLEL